MSDSSRNQVEVRAEEQDDSQITPDDVGDLPNAGLTDKQLRATELLVAGQRPGAVAKAIGVSREQLWRWRTKNPAFGRHLETLRLELHASRVDRLWTLMDKSLDVVEEALDEGDPQTAMQLLRLPGLHLSDAGVPSLHNTPAIERGGQALDDD